MKSPAFTILGTGGIGTGVVYMLEGGHTLGREESRAGHLLPIRDFCKLHIILHYVTVLMKDAGISAHVVPVSCVGADAEGKMLISLMAEAGMDTACIQQLKGVPTMRSVCFQYPDKSGGNITESRSACSKVGQRQMSPLTKLMSSTGGKLIAIAAPEVPMPARESLLRIGRRHGAFNVASFSSLEMSYAKRKLLGLVDLLAVNMDEAAVLGDSTSAKDHRKTVSAATDFIRKSFPGMRLSVTAGKNGSYSFHDGVLEHLPCVKVNAVSTAGAGDAFLSGILFGMSKGLPFHGEPASAVRMGRLVAGMSVMSPDSINFSVNQRTLRSFAKKHGEFPILERIRD